MYVHPPFQGTLFAESFLRSFITELPDWSDITDAFVDEFETRLSSLFAGFPIDGSPNESQTEEDIIWPILGELGWTESLPQQNLSTRGREHVPDILLFGDTTSKDRANTASDEWRRYEYGLAIVESKRWLRPLDRRSGAPGEETAPSTQILRYLRRIDDLTTGKLRWGILTNGCQWRLYYQGAPSVSENFFELDLSAVLDMSGRGDELNTLTPPERRHWLRLFLLVFGHDSFQTGAVDKRTFHQRAIDESRFYQERVTASLSDLVFDRIFPDLARAIAVAAPDVSLSDVRDTALILLYRLLFILYAEDRNLLPVRDSRYEPYSVREKVRGEIMRRKDSGDVFSDNATQYWSVIDDLCRAIDVGDASIGIPPYNGGLFDQQRTPLLSTVRLNDSLVADIIDALSFEQTTEGRSYINYRDLGVQQLGSIYEQLLEREIVYEEDGISVRPNSSARKDSGSYYTPDDLVGLLIREAVDPLIRYRMSVFSAEVSKLASNDLPKERSIGRLRHLDPAEAILKLKICDPSMGSGHFLVNLVDHLTDHVIEAMAEAEASWDNYISPLNEKIDHIRNSIIANAKEQNWTLNQDRLDDRHIVRRMVLKRCVYGVDKNPMAVELAKVSLWLHTFTVGAPLSFLDHHLRCGDSLFGSWVRPAIDRAEQHNGVFVRTPLTRAARAAGQMHIIEGLTDAEIAEVHRSADVFAEVEYLTAPLDAFLSLFLAFDWMRLKHAGDLEVLKSWLSGLFGDPVVVAMEGVDEKNLSEPLAQRFAELLRTARKLIEHHRFLNWQVTFPGVWSKWEESELHGGFDAVVGNPPWDRMKLQQIEWFAARRREIAIEPRAADRKRLIAKLDTDDPLAQEFKEASENAALALQMARSSNDYPLLAHGDVNLYSLFVERAMRLVKPDGIVGLLVPSGIASDKTTANFFKKISKEGQLLALYDFENRRTRIDLPPFFPDVHSSFKFCTFVACASSIDTPARCGFFLQDVSEVKHEDRCFPVTADEFARVNPNTGTAPIFRSRRDAEITNAIYCRLPVLVDHSLSEPVRTWPIRYQRMLDMTNDSRLFHTRSDLEETVRAWPISNNRYESSEGKWVPLYEGKMVQAFDHRAASVLVNPNNLHRPAQKILTSEESHRDPNWFPNPRYWVLQSEVDEPSTEFLLGFKHVTATTNARSMIATLIPAVAAGNSFPLLRSHGTEEISSRLAALMLANLNSLPLDFVLRQKVQGQNLNWYIIEQLPVVPLDSYETISFGSKKASEIGFEAVLELTYTSHDMEPFALGLDYVDQSGEVLPPFIWNEDRRLQLRAKLDALFFHLYGLTNREDIRYIFSTFPIVEQQERKTFGRYRSLELSLAWFNALAAGNPDAEVDA